MSDPAAVFDLIEAALPSEGERLQDVIRGDIQFKVGDAHYHLALTKGAPPAVTRGAAGDGEGGKKADLTVTVSEADFMTLCSGELSPMTAFMQKKVRVKGKMPLALKLEKVLVLARPRARL